MGVVNRPAAIALTVVVIAGLAAALVVEKTGGSSHHRPHAAISVVSPPVRTTSTSTTSTTAPLPPTFLGPAGVEARWVITENERPGTAAWQIAGAGGGIAGFADHVAAQVGVPVTFYVTTAAPSFRVEAFRMGYYQGKGARLIWQSGELPGTNQPACPVTGGTNMVACDNWAPSLHLTLTPAFLEGDYLFKLVGSQGQQSYVPLTVWNPTSTAAYLVKNDVYTWQAWNPYGGYDFYTGLGACPRDVYPICSRARVASFDRPYGYGQGAADFLGNEYPLVRFAEQHGLDVTYVTDVTVEEHPTVLLAHTTLLSLGHDECWSLGERQAAVTAQAHGVNIVFFAASPVLRHVRPQASPLGADREVVDYRDSSSDPLDGRGNPLDVTGNTWSAPPSNWPEIGFVGEQYAGYLEPGAAPAPFVVADPSAWIFAGTGLSRGSAIPDVLLSDFDEFDPGTHPANLQILAHSPVPLGDAESSIGSERGVAYSDMTYYTDPSSQAGVLDTGTNNWIPALEPCAASQTSCPAAAVAQITGNLLHLFGQGPAGRLQPSNSNWQQVYG